ncbi:ABC transporter ATP-binding protein [Hyphococcus sp.]|uniref:ABC transporter ATP-binding protein n=1 Tax=Hyphococcus sp. TaxID=2038636 RepID=UPI0035C747EA
MAHIIAQNVSLSFPLHGRSGGGKFRAKKADQGRLVFNKAGRIIAVKAINNVSLELDSGDRLAIIGGNGSGKTTLLQLLAGIILPDEGSIEVEGAATSVINLNLGMEAEANGHQNITLRGLAAGRSREEIEICRADIAEFSELGRFLDLPVHTYSAGMRMRLSFAIATAFKPEVLILDEWMSAGDASFRKRASQRMQEFVDQAGILVLASHSSRLILENCNKAIWLKDGSISAFGDVEEIVNLYESDIRPGAEGRKARRADNGEGDDISGGDNEAGRSATALSSGAE